MSEPAEIDYAFRPSSYWNDAAAVRELLPAVRRAADRDAIVAYWEAGRLDALPPELAFQLGSAGEREIARLEMGSTALSVRASLRPREIHYRVLELRGRERVVASESRRLPLSLGELVKLVDACGDQSALAAARTIRSPFYLQLAQHYLGSAPRR
jgi:hypothetical protein